MTTYKKFLVVAPDMYQCFYAPSCCIRGSFETKAEADLFAVAEGERTHTDHYVRDRDSLDPNNLFDKDYIREINKV